MNKFLEELKNQPDALTENGAATYSSSGSACLNLFFQIGALRGTGRNPWEIFEKAYKEDPTLALRILFFARDIRQGLGEREVFRGILKELAKENPEAVEKNFAFIAEMGRYDDWLCLLDTPCAGRVMEEIRSQLIRDLQAVDKGEPVSLLAKWLPSINATRKETIKSALGISKALGMRVEEYRKKLSLLRRKLSLVENNLRTRDYTFSYEHVPSKALFRYRAAFWRNDEERYAKFLERAKENPSIMHTGTLEPYSIIAPLLNRFSEPDEQTKTTLDVSWRALEDYTGGDNSLVVMDGSGSMYGGYGGNVMPITVAMSLAIYFAERNKGAFRNHFITFSKHPKLVEILGADIYHKVKYCSQFNEAANTNLASVFDLILNTAVEKHLPQEELPSRLYIISDMEFDECVEGCRSVTNFEAAKRRFAKAGYKLPEVIFWNVSAWQEQAPVKKNEVGVALVSGFTPKLFTAVQGNVVDPYSMMLKILNSPRYQGIGI